MSALDKIIAITRSNSIRGPMSAGGFLVAECPANIGNRLEDARLISAAPELLELAQSILADDMLQYLPDEYTTKVRAVIAKATGSDT